MNNFQENIDLLSDKELLKVINSKDDYQEEFWELAVINAEQRNLNNEVQTIKLEIQKKEMLKKPITKEENDLIELYSERAIITFSILFSTIAGAILLSNNLKKLGRKGGNNVITFGISYTLALFILIKYLPFMNSLGYLLNIAGGFILTVYFETKYYPNKLDYKNKKIWKALIIAVSITVFLVFLYLFMMEPMG